MSKFYNILMFLVIVNMENLIYKYSDQQSFYFKWDQKILSWLHYKYLFFRSQILYFLYDFNSWVNKCIHVKYVIETTVMDSDCSVRNQKSKLMKKLPLLISSWRLREEFLVYVDNVMMYVSSFISKQMYFNVLK